MDAMSSVLSYNDLNLAPVLEEGIRVEEEKEDIYFLLLKWSGGAEERTKSKDETLHETTFMKQFFYFLIMLIMNAGYEQGLLSPSPSPQSPVPTSPKS